MISKQSRETSSPRLGRWRHCAIALASLVLAACGGGGGSGGDHTPLELRTLSNRADLVSGGDVLMEVVVPASRAAAPLKVTLNGTDITGAFQRRPDGRIIGLVTGLKQGNNVVEASAGDPRPARLTVTNAPKQGPIFSGAQVTPFYCATPTPQPASGDTPATNGSGLGGLPDAGCNIATEYKLYYRTTAAPVSAANPSGCSLGMPDPAWNTSATATTIPPQPTAPVNACWKPYTPGSTPSDIASTTTDTGVTVPFIVRVERGTMNRGIYDIAVLYQPGKPWTPLAPQASWNGKVYYNFGFSTGQPRRQSRPTLNWSGAEESLKRGFMYVGNSMTDSSRNSNRVLMAETVMMMKEHIGDSYGPVKYTMGTGCSGGSINSNMALSIFPGLLDGVVTSCTYPDSETTSMEVGDCTLLVEAYQKAPLTALWAGRTQAEINAKKGAINGHPDQSGCHAWYNAFGNNGRAGLYAERLVADNVTGALVNTGKFVNNCELPNSAVYDPAHAVATANLPRCDAWSWGESIWGKATGTNAARRTTDNVGVQYGLKALMAGRITAEEFVTLNEVIGGTDRDGTFRAERSTADPEALDTAYRAGIVASGRQLAKAAIIDLRGWDDSNITTPPGVTPGTNPIPIHHQWFSWAVRDRITREYGDAGNQALWRFARNGLQPSPALALDAFLTMDRWLTDLVTSSVGTTIEARVRSTRPSSARDFCLLSSDAAQSTRVYDTATCDADPFLAPAASPRQAAGGPRSEDVLKCQLKPLNQADYAPNTFTPALWARMQNLFAGGVCDWSKPGVGQQLAESPLTFRNGPGGEPLPPAPSSRKQLQ